VAAHDSLQFAHELRLEQATQSLLLKHVMDAGLAFIRMDAWATSATSLEAVGEPQLRFSTEGGDQSLFRFDEEVVHVSLFHGHAACTAAAVDEETALARVRRLREILPPPDPSSAHEVNVTFWTYGPHGPQPSWRSISVPEWDEIRENYAAPTREALEGLMSGFRPAHGGQLVLWHGEAGTGKTFALRALAWEWRNWCDLHYIVDPDSFFGEHADYLMSVLLQPQYAMPMHVMHGAAWASFDEGGSVEILRDQADDQRRSWQLLILEDTGELLTADAKAVIGQGLSRFLNVVDGLIGQGLRVLVLVTTNEAIRTLHPAVARPGRCAANVEFGRLSAEEAQDWLQRHEVEGESPAATTLASLYARAAGLEDGDRPLTGFGG
jgi:SpoVK/Ycf46/Vps4 family AAA+-type ATPase